MTISPDSIQPNTRRYAGISFRPEVMDYLDVLAAKVGMSRSWVLNTIVSEHAKRQHALEPTSLLSKETVIPFDQ